MNARVDLTFNDVAAILDYNQETGILHWKVARGPRPAGGVAGHPHGNGYIRVQINRYGYFAHRLAWLLTTGAWPSDQVDHINGCRGDNRWCNLREATNAQNQQNRNPRRDNKSGFTGVSFHKRIKRWRAQIRHRGAKKFLGDFDTPQEASTAYLAAKSKLHPFQPVPRS